jgi:hypothetical protein
MAGRIVIESSEKGLNLAGGERGLITLTLTNASNVVDAFDVAINDLDPAWYTLTPNKVSLFPKAKGVTTLQLHPPMSSRHPAGDYPFTVVVTSRDAADETATLPLQITLAASGDLSAELEPQRIVGRQGTFRLAVNNAGNYDRQVVLRPTDNEEKLFFAFGAPQFFPLASAKPKTGPDDETAVYNVAQAQNVGQADFSQAPPQPEWTPPNPESGQGYLTLTIPTATRLEIPLTAKRREREWFGMEIPQRIEVNVTPPGVEWEAKDARKATAELVYQPILAWMNGIPLGLRRALAFLIPLLILGLLLFLLLRPQDNNNAGAAVSQTQTAQALGNAQTQTALALSLSQTQTALAGNGNLSAADLTATAQAGGGLSSADLTATARALSAADLTATAQAGGGPLRIVNFDWDSASGTFQAVWEVAPTQGVTVTINKTPVPPVGSMPFDPSEDRSLILEASNGSDIVSRALGAVHLRAPSIRLFTTDAAPGTSVAPGTTVTLSWETSGSERVLLNDAPVDGPNGSLQVTPSSTTEYLLTAENSVGSVISRLTVNVAAP